MRRVPREHWFTLFRVVRRRASAPASPLSLVGTDARRIIFVCHGNIMRSAFADVCWNSASLNAGSAASIEAVSAGTDARHGRAAHPLAAASAEQLGISLNAHRATPLSEVTLASGDVLVGFDCENEVQLQSLARRHPGVRVLLLGDLAGNGGTLDAEIRDPWGTSETATMQTFQRIRGLLDALRSQLQPQPSC